MLRPLRWRRLWVGAWIAMILGVVVLSLMPSPPIPGPLTIDKFDHGLAYFCLAAMAVQLFDTRAVWFVAAAWFVLLGVALELAQGLLTTYRGMSAYDAMIDAVGAALGLATGWTPLRDLLKWLDARMPGRGD